MRFRIAIAASLALLAAVPSGHSASPAPELDVVIAGGRVLDGSGNPWFHADVGIVADRVVALGDLSGAAAVRRIDASGLWVTPGFVDIHSHADEGETSLANPDTAAALNLVTQGITTVVVGQDGRCRCPVGERAELYGTQGVGPNVVQLVGHGAVRRQVIGEAERSATPEEIAAMAELVASAMAEGAAGLSSGLEYVPGRFAATAEVVELAGVVAARGGFYISHQRSEGRTPMWWLPSMGGDPPDLFDAVLETIHIGEATGMPVVASHIKVKGADFWGAAPALTRLIEEARARGVQVYADQYPYETTGSDGNTVLIPRWAFAAPEDEEPLPEDVDRATRFEAYRQRLRRILDDPEAAAALRADVAHEIRRRGGAGRLLLLEAHREDYVGKHLAEVAALHGLSAVEVAIQLALEGLDRPGGARIRGFSLDDVDVAHYMARPWTATCTDGGIAVPGEGWPHPRFYGTYPRKLARYARDRGVVSLADAVRSSTSLPADIVGLRRRGRLRAGAAADVVVLDLEALRDRSVALDPHRYSEGVGYVWINGALVVEAGQATGALPGRVLDRRDGDEYVARTFRPVAAERPATLPHAATLAAPSGAR